VANIKSAKKRIKTSEKSKSANRQVKSSVRTAAKKVNSALDPKNENHGKLAELQKGYVKAIDSAAGKGVVKKKTAARKKSRLAKKINAAAKQTTAPQA